MTNDTPEYMLGTSDEEITRLAHQHQVWLDEAVSLWRMAGFAFGQQILDLGCGPGFATLNLAYLVGPNGTVFAVDASERYIRFLEHQLEAADLRNIVTQVADVHRLDAPDESIDGVFARWLMCFVESPAKVASEVYRVLRPGGTLVVKDYFNYSAVKIYPIRDSFAKLFNGYYESAIRHGGTYNIGEKLPEILRRSGLELVLLKPICRIGQPGSATWQWLALFNNSYIPKLVEQGIMSEAERESFNRDWATVSQDPSAFFFTPPMLGIVARKPK